MTDLKMVFREAQKLNGRIRGLLGVSTYEKYDDLSGLSIDYKDGEQLFLQTELREIMDAPLPAESGILHHAEGVDLHCVFRLCL